MLLAGLLALAFAAPTAPSAVTLDRRLSCAASTVSGSGTVFVYFDPGYENSADMSVEANGAVLAQTTIHPLNPFSFNRENCRPSTVRMPLTRVGLPPDPTRFETSKTCLTGARVLVRIRVVRDRPNGRVLSSTVSVRTGAGKPLAFVVFSGARRLFYSSTTRCH